MIINDKKLVDELIHIRFSVSDTMNYVKAIHDSNSVFIDVIITKLKRIGKRIDLILDENK